MDRELPRRWADRLVARGFTDRRGSEPRPSLGALADETGLHVTTLKNAITGARRPSHSTVVALQGALGSDVVDWLASPEIRPWSPPSEAELLTDRQRKAVEELIRAMTEQRKDVRNDDRSASTKDAGAEPAPVTQLPTAAALDPTMPENVAARSLPGKGKTQAERDRQDEEGEG